MKNTKTGNGKIFDFYHCLNINTHYSSNKTFNKSFAKQNNLTLRKVT